MTAKKNETVRVTMNLPVEIIACVDAYAERKHINRTTSVILLLATAIKTEL